MRLVRQFEGAGLKNSKKFMSYSLQMRHSPGQKDAAVGFLAAGNWAPDMPNEANKAFVSAFEEKYGYIPGGYAMQATTLRT